MTEEEAKTKWCPCSGNRICAAAILEKVIYNSNLECKCLGSGSGCMFLDKFIEDNGLDGKCLGSGCMWWITGNSKFKDSITGQLHDRNLTGHGKWINEGYCGHARKI